MRQSIKPIPAPALSRRLLLKKQAELFADLKMMSEDIHQLREPAPEENRFSVTQQHSIAQRLSAVESSELGRVNAALERLRSGVYGICQRCGASIPATRLKAVPWAEHCRKCASGSSAERVAGLGRVH